MEKIRTSQRLREIMDLRGLRQIDIVNLVKPVAESHGVTFTRAYLSQYLSDRCEPTQEKVYVMAKALNVSEAWLMGFNTPMARKEIPTNFSRGEEDAELLEKYHSLSAEHKKIVDYLISSLIK